MSEFLAEARILVRPDTSRFRADLEAQLASVVRRPIQIPVVPVVTAGAFTAAVAGTSAFVAAQEAAAAATAVTSDALATATTIERQYAGAVDLSTVAVQAQAAAQEKEAIAATTAAAATARSNAQLGRGAAASALSLFGLRGATLAASGAFLAGTAAVVGFSKAIQSAASLETELNVFKATAAATADEMERVSAEAKQLGRDITLPGVTASDAATALTELSKAGLSVRDSMAAARGTLQLATAAQISNAEAAKLVSSALNSFQLDGSQAVKVADLFAGAAANAQGSIQDFGPALGQASAVANAFGLSIGDTVALLTQLAKAGLQGGRAGTSLRVALLRLVNPPAEAAKALKDLNVQVRDVNGNLRPQVFTDIEEALQGVSVAQRQATEAIIFGSDAVRTQVILGKAGAEAFREISAAVNESGLAQEQAAARTQGLQGDMENLSNQVSALGLTLGQVATGPTSAFVKGLSDMVGEMVLAADGAVALGGKLRDLGESIPGSSLFGPFVGLLQKGAEVSNPLTLSLKLASDAAKRLGVDSEGASTKLTVFDGIAKSVTDTTNGLANALTKAAAASRAQQPQLDTGLNVKQIQNVIGGFDAQEVRAKIEGDNAKLLEVLRTEQEFLERQLQRDFVKRRPELQRAIEQALLGTVTDIRGIEAAAQARNEQFKAGVKRVAEANARAAEQAAKEIEASAKSIQENLNAAAEAIVAAAVARRQALLRGLSLDVDFAQITGNQQAEVKARTRLINQLTKDLQAEAKAHGKNTVAYKEIRNQIAQETAAINEITKEQQKNNSAQSFAQATFDFLQTQQGFASNLLGNLIPGGATGGLVGGGSPVQDALNPQAGFADGQAKSGPTSGQAQTTNGLLAGILNQLKQLNGDNSAPEAQRQNRGQRAVMDGVGGG